MRLFTLALLLFVAGRAFAQDVTPPPLVPLDSVEEPGPRTKPREDEAARAAVHAAKQDASLDRRPEWARSRAARFLAEMGGALIGTGLGGSFGLLAACAASTDGFGRCPAGGGPLLLLGGVGGMVLRMAPGAWIAGEAAGGDGSLGAAYGGEVLGSLFIFPAVLALNAMSSGGRTADIFSFSAVVFICLLPIVGTAALYELSVGLGEDGEAEKSAKLYPVVAPTRSGAFAAGLGGAF